MNKKNDTSWNTVADWYDDLLGSTESYQQQVILPNLTRLLGNMRGKRVLDIASGQGLFSHAFAKMGSEVVGIELSRELVAIAREQATPKETFYISSAEAFPQEIKNDSFDLCVCVLALQNIQNIDAVISEASRALHSGGRFLMVLNHPAFRIPKRSSWGFDEEHKLQYRRMDGYMSESSERIAMHPGKSNKIETISFHRPLQVYFKAFTKHHLLIERLEEWISHKTSEQGPRKSTEDHARKEFPLFLFLGLRKE